MSYKKKQSNPPEYPDYITFCKLGACVDILGDTSFALQLQEEAVNGTNTEIGEDFIKNGQNINAISVNSNAAAYRLIMLAHLLTTCERHNLNDKIATVKRSLQERLTEYLSNDYVIDSMKAPFKDWQQLLDQAENNAEDKISILEKMSRAILI